MSVNWKRKYISKQKIHLRNQGPLLKQTKAKTNSKQYNNNKIKKQKLLQLIRKTGEVTRYKSKSTPKQ